MDARVTLPADIDLNSDPILRLHYVGDVARVTLNRRLLTDDFYNGNVFEVGLRRYAPEILDGELRVAILALREDAPIYLANEARPDFGDQPDELGSRSGSTFRFYSSVPRFLCAATAGWIRSANHCCPCLFTSHCHATSSPKAFIRSL
jgi:hypothetical protein